MNSPQNTIAQFLVEEVEPPPLPLAELTWRRFVRHKMAIFGLIVLALLILYSFGGGFFVSEAYANQTDTSLRLDAPVAAHPFGTDTVGRDILARTMYDRPDCRERGSAAGDPDRSARGLLWRLDR
jgi:ABC-type dipeptide/oligopeptide/nickel transport system permease subunit